MNDMTIPLLRMRANSSQVPFTSGALFCPRGTPIGSLTLEYYI